MAVLVSGVVALIALTITPGYLYLFDVTPKVSVLLAGVLGMLIWWIARRSSPGRDVPRAFSLLLLAFWVSAAISTVASIEPGLSLSGAVWRRLGLLSWTALLLFAWFAAAWLRARQENMALLLRTVALSGSLAAGYGILQFFGWDPWLPARAYHVGEDPWTIVRPPSTLGYVTYFAAYLVNVIGAGAALYLTERPAIWRVAGVVAASLGIAATVLSGTRAAMLGLAAGCVFFCGWWRAKLRFRRLLPAAAVLAAAFTAFYLSPAGLKLRARTRWYVEDATGGPRPWLWRDSLKMAGVHPVAGYGPETFSVSFPGYQSEALAQRYPDFAYESPHHILVDVLVAQGVPGLLIMVSLLVWTWRQGWRAASAGSTLARVALAMLAASLVNHTFGCFSLPTALFFFLNLAILASLTEGAKRREESFMISSRWVRAMVAAPLAIALTGYGIRLGAADLAAAETSRHIEHGRLAEAARSYARVLRWQPPGVSVDLWYSRSMTNAALSARDLAVRLGAGSEALAAARRATGTAEERHNAWYHLAALTATAGAAEETEENLRAAIAVSPNWYKPHWTLARLLLAQGNYAEAEREAARAFDLGGNKHPEVVQTLDRVRSLRAGRR